MKYLFYTTSQSAWDGLYNTMQSAETSIYLEMYIFVDDTKQASDFITLLSDKAKNGVRVRIVLDWFGSFSLSNEAQKKLRAAGVELLFFRKFFRRLHHKVMIVDEKVGFLGGVNIHRSARMWDDLLVRLEGPIVNSLIKSFHRIYKLCGGKDPQITYHKQKVILGRARIWILEHIPFIRKPRLRDAYTEAIISSKQRVVIVTPYFTPNKWLIQLLRDTVNRGIKIEVIVPARTDIAFLSRANRRYMNMLSEDGIIFYLLPRMNHAKLLLVDESLALLGSANIDALSFDFNTEVGIFLNDQKMLADIEVIVDSWKAKANPLKVPLYVSLIDRLLSILVRILQPFL